jgi:hypothetical protein
MVPSYKVRTLGIGGHFFPISAEQQP